MKYIVQIIYQYVLLEITRVGATIILVVGYTLILLTVLVWTMSCTRTQQAFDYLMSYERTVGFNDELLETKTYKTIFHAIWGCKPIRTHYTKRTWWSDNH